jgi:hypothetical protein
MISIEMVMPDSLEKDNGMRADWSGFKAETQPIANSTMPMTKPSVFSRSRNSIIHCDYVVVDHRQPLRTVMTAMNMPPIRTWCSGIFRHEGPSAPKQ